MEVNKTYHLTLTDDEFAILINIFNNVKSTVSQFSGIDTSDIQTFNKMLAIVNGSSIGD